MGISVELASYCESLTYDDLPAEVIDRTKMVLLDTIGIAIGSVRAESTPVVLDGIRELDADGHGDVTVLGTGERLSPAYAALANATLAHTLDYDETHRAGSVHATAPVLGGALAAAEPDDRSGRELLTAVVAGYEVTARLGMALNSESHYARGFHGTSTCGTFGAAAAVGSLEGFDTDEIGTAFGLNGSQAAGSLQFLENGAWNKRLHPGLAAHSGYLATTFANRGFFAASEPIEGPRGFLQAYSDDPLPDRAVDGLGDGYEITNTGLKPYPLCRFMHPAIDGLIDLVDEHDVAPDDVISIEVGMSTSGANIVGDPTNQIPESVVEAQFSMPFGAMLAVTRRSAGVDDLFGSLRDGFTDEEDRCMRATTTEPVDWADDLYPEQWAVEVLIETADGDFEKQVENARGDPQTPLSWADVREKYAELVEPVVGTETSDRLRERVEKIEEYSTRELLAPVRNATFEVPV